MTMKENPQLYITAKVNKIRGFSLFNLTTVYIITEKKVSLYYA